MTDRLRNLLGQLTDDQPVVTDWPAQVRHTVVVRRQRQRLVAAAAAVLLVAGTGAAVLANAPAEQDALIGAADPSPTSSLSAESSAAPSAQPSAATTPTGAATPAASPAPAPSAQEPEPEPAPSRTSTPSYPQRGSQDIEITARTEPERPVAGEEWVLEVTVTGFAENEPFLQKPCIEGEMCEYATPGCAGPAEGQSPPPASPQRVERTFRHTFPEPGSYDVRLEADSACSYYYGRDELLLVVEVGEAPPEPAPTPSPTASS